MRGWLRRLSLKFPPWVDKPAPPGWPDSLWALMYTVRYVLALIIVMGLFVLLLKLPV